MSCKFTKLAKYLKLDIPLLNPYNSVSGVIFANYVEDYFTLSVFFGYLQEIFRKNAQKQFKTFTVMFEQIFLPEFNENKHSFNEILSNSSIKLLKKILLFESKFTDREVIRKLEAIKEKKSEIAFIIKVSLFFFLSKIRKIEEDEKIKKDLKAKLKSILRNDKLEYSRTNCMFLASIFKINLLVFSEENLKAKPERYYYKKKQEEKDDFITLALLKDKKEEFHILLSEDVEFQDDKRKILTTERKMLETQQELVIVNHKFLRFQQKFNKMNKCYKNSLKISELLFESIKDLTKSFIKFNESPLSLIKIELSNSALISSNLKRLEKYENELSIFHHNEENRVYSPIPDMKKSLKKICLQLRQFSENEEVKSGDNQTYITEMIPESIDDEDDRNAFEKENLINSNNILKINNSLQQNFQDEARIKHEKKDISDYDNIKSNYEKTVSNEEMNEKLDEIIRDDEIKNFTCPICCEDVSQDSVFSFSCGHKACKQCVADFFLQRYDSGQWGFEIQCFMGDCSLVMNSSDSIHILKQLIGTEKVDRMSEKAARDLAGYQCAGCKVSFMLDPDNTIQNFYCEICKAITCLKCGELKHKELFGCKKKINEMQVALKNERMRCCPVCLEIYLKDENCEHVQCLKCKTDFCYNCSAEREPILAHGMQFHRRGCKYFFRYIDVKTKKEILLDEIEKKCKKCIINNEVCKRPEKDLKTFYETLGLELENEENPNDND